MLTIINSMGLLSFSRLMQVYSESNRDNGSVRYPNLSEGEQLLCAEQDFYQYLSSIFFHQEDSCYAVWEEDDKYYSALRLEPYRDGMLLCALETIPDERGRGYAKSLIRAVQVHLADNGSGVLYSHISKNNGASLAVHRCCGFHIILDHAVYADGSVIHNSYTLAYTYTKSESSA